MATQPTNLPVPSESPRDLKFNAGKIDEFVTSESSEYIDRFGGKHRTIAGINYDANQAITNYGYITKDSFEDGSTISNANECLRWKSNGEYYRWDGTFPKVVPPASTPDSTGGIGQGKWIGVGDASLRSNLNSDEGAGLVRTTTGNTVQQELDKRLQPAEVNIKDFVSLRDAIAALPSDGGVVNVPVGRFYSGSWNPSTDYMSKPNVHIRGVKMPTWNDDASSLVGGSVIEGRLSACAHNLTVSNVGFDLGKSVCDARYPGADTTSDHPDGGTWDAFSFEQPSQSTPVSARRNLVINNVIGLLNDSLTVGHAILIENVNGGHADNVIGIYGVHAVVIKSNNMQIGRISGYMASTDNVIFKSDTYALGGNIQVSEIVAEQTLPNCTPHSTPANCQYNVYFNPETENYSGPIQIDSIRVRGGQYGVIGSSVNLKSGADISIGKVYVDGATEWGVFFANFGEFPRLSFGDINLTNVKNGFFNRYTSKANSGNAQTSVNSIKITYCEGLGIYTADYARVCIGTVEMYGAGTAYYQDDNTIIKVGTENLVSVNAKWGNSPYSIGSGWSNYGGGNSTFDVKYIGYGIKLSGLLLAGTGVSGTIVNLPEYLRPKESLRFLAYLNISGTLTPCLIGVSTAGIVSINDGLPPAVGSFVSLDGISWQMEK
ncbi:hypothetical protein [Citrobacter portucalensis]|uniref:tail fiber/spike domain-containing protein n=1 Tax=Citrobacter portucalensis TaxID=1639133 RepID=UPI00292BD3DC|nr:hypothetical protein [Citrobacter portucalensis]MDV0582479.1 hypothetical protein [Citrobacter portucalensis]MEB0659179.1 hypothetical protein [Citrobacter portucalensis]MEB0699269.1 hypothetical protein [Citrobacter portucalensis]